MYLLDTNHCSRLILNDRILLNRILQVQNRLIFTSVIVRGELIHMAKQSQQKDRNLALVSEFFQGIRVYSVDNYTADIYGEIKAALIAKFGAKQKSKQRVVKIRDIGFDDNDIWIAATALQYNLTIVSADSDFTRMQSAKAFPLENWCN
jgi:tRNA(fMet)-specific endonuclease VapC